jgi:hypothetical protein
LPRPAVEVADIFRRRGPAWRASHAGHVSLGQLKVMSAIERCRTAALGGHVERCEVCAHLRISYNSCRDRHCPKCQAVAAKQWLADRQAELLPVPYFHVVFTLPRPIADIAYQNKAVVYDLLLKTAAETLITIAADPKHLGARIGLTAVLHTWGSTLTHHPHAHIIVPGGGFSPDRQRWITCRPGFFLSVRVLSRLFRRLFLERLTAAYQAGRLHFFTDQAALAEPAAFQARLAALRKRKCRVDGDVAIPIPQSGRIEARTGLRMMPTSPRSPLSFRTAGFPQYGWKDGVSDGAFPTRRSVQACSRHTLTTYWFASVLRASRRIHECPAQCRVGYAPMHRRGGWVILLPRGPRSSPGCAVPVCHHLIDPIRPTRRHITTSPQGGLYAMPSLCGSA